MRAVEAKAFGGPEVLVVGEATDPVAGAGEVVVEVAAADVMFLDTRLRNGWGGDYFGIETPYVPGGAVAGVVVAVGEDVDPAWVGRRVAAPTASSGIGPGSRPVGGYAEKALAKADTLMPVPDGLSLEQAVALTHDGRTAMVVAERAAFRSGEWVLITAAAGGLGVLLIQLARAAGANVIGAARGTAKLDLVRRLGANAAIDYSESGWVQKVVAATGGVGVQLVLDGAGGVLGRAALDAAVDGARFLGYGAAAGDFAEPDIEALASRGITVHGLLDMTAAKEIDWRARGERALAEAAAGRLEVVIGQSFPLERAADAHAAIESRAAVGRTILITQ